MPKKKRDYTIPEKEGHTRYISRSGRELYRKKPIRDSTKPAKGNKWIEFLKSIKGKGHKRADIRKMYHESKSAPQPEKMKEPEDEDTWTDIWKK